jgi:hypothetical protein
MAAQSNWVFSQFIDYQFANEVIFNVTFRFTRCNDMPNCVRDYVTMYRYDTNGIASDRTDRTKYVPLLGVGREVESRLQQGAASGAVRMEYELTLPTTNRTTGFYLGIEDDGTCGSVNRIIVFFRFVEGRVQDLLTCPPVALPPSGSTSPSQRECVCHANASSTGATLSRVCNLNGVCNEDQACACSPGFTLANGRCVGTCIQ